MLNFGLNKRQKIIVVCIFVTLGLLSTQLVNFNLRFRFMVGLTIFSYLLSVWALWEGLNERSSEDKRGGFYINIKKAIILLLPPALFTLSVTSFYFLLPIRWLTRIPVAFIFSLLFYLLLLAQNVFNVASIRTIPLYRAASTTLFLFTVFSAFCLYSVTSALNLLFIWNGVAIFVISFLLTLPIIWSIEMEDRLSSSVVIHSLILSLILGELGLVLSFWPTHSSIRPYAVGATLTSSIYVLLGLTTQHLRGRLNRREIVEYLVFGFMVWLVAYIITSGAV